MNCKYCVKGWIVVPLPIRAESGRVIGYMADRRVCSCCGGNYENCKQCERDEQDRLNPPDSEAGERRRFFEEYRVK